MTTFAIGWQVGALTGWGQYGAQLARALHETGHTVVLPLEPGLSGVLPLDAPLLSSLRGPIPDTDCWLFVPLGNAIEARPQGIPAGVQVCALCVFEDSGALDDEAVERLKAYDRLIAPSTWVQGMLAGKGLDAVVCHQGYDGRVFFPSPRKPASRPVVFSGGKLEFRKGQDITIEAFKRFRATPDGKDALLVTAWHNPWPATMDGIWLSGYVKGVPTMRAGRPDIAGWLELNGVPRAAVVDCGPLSPPELAEVMRSCTVGVFPSRAEGATNLVLVEALATGLPCIFGDWTGQADVARAVSSDAGLMATNTAETMPVPAGCRLYRSTDGWAEEPAQSWVHALRNGGRTSLLSPTYWDWTERAPAFAKACLTAVPA